MTTAQTIITRAFRQENLIPVGTSPTTDELTEGLEILNSLIDQFYGFELGEITFDWQVPVVRNSAYAVEDPRDPYGQRESSRFNENPPNNVRLVTKIPSATTVFFPEYPNNGSRVVLADAGSPNPNLTLNANGRKIEGADSIAVDLATVTEREWFYRSDQANWQRRETLTLGDESPFPLKFDALLVTGTAIWLSPRYGREPRQITQAIFSDMRSKFEATYYQETPTDVTYNLRNIQSFRYTNTRTGEFING